MTKVPKPATVLWPNEYVGPSLRDLSHPFFSAPLESRLPVSDCGEAVPRVEIESLIAQGFSKWKDLVAKNIAPADPSNILFVTPVKEGGEGVILFLTNTEVEDYIAQKTEAERQTWVVQKSGKDPYVNGDVSTTLVHGLYPVNIPEADGESADREVTFTMKVAMREPAEAEDMFTPAKSETETKTYLICPSCGKNTGSTIDHIGVGPGKVSSGGPWSCDACGVDIWLKWDSESNSVLVRAVTSPEKRTDSCYDLLVIPPQTKPIYLVVASKNYGESHLSQAEIDDRKGYWYNSHTCPTNWIRDVRAIVCGQDTDPHGLARYVTSVQKSKCKALDESERFDSVRTEEVFPQVVTHCDSIDITKLPRGDD